MASKPKIIVELTSDEQRLLDGFRKAQVADEEFRKGLKKTEDQADKTGKEMIDSMLKAAKATTKGTDQMMKDLKRLGPLGKKIFDDMSMDSREAVDKIIDELEKISPAMAAEAKLSRDEWDKMAPHITSETEKWNAAFDKHNIGAKNTFTDFSVHAVKQIAAVGAAYVGISEVIQGISQSLNDQQQVLLKSADYQQDIAAVQKTALTNLYAFSQSDQDKIMNEIIPGVAETANFPNIGMLVQTAGELGASGATSTDAMKKILMATAGITRENPDQAPGVGAAIQDAILATGDTDPEKALSRAMVAGSQSRVINQTKVLRNMTPVMIAAVNALPAGSSDKLKMRTAREASAFFTAYTKGGADTQGETSMTGSIQMLGRMNTFFNNLGGNATAAESELKALQDPISETQRLQINTLSMNEANKNRNDAKRVSLNTRRAEIQKKLRSEGLDPSERRRLSYENSDITKELTQLKKSEFTDVDSARLSDLRSSTETANAEYQAKRAELEATIAAAKVPGYRGRIPLSPFEQARVLQGNDAYREAFFAQGPFGEQRNRASNISIATGRGQVWQNALRSEMLQRTIGDDVSGVRRLSSDTDWPTLQAKEASIRRTAQTAEALFDYSNKSAGVGATRKMAADTYQATRTGNALQRAGQYFSEFGTESGATTFGDSDLSQQMGVFRGLIKRVRLIDRLGVGPEDSEELKRLDSNIKTVIKRIATTDPALIDPAVLQTEALRTDFRSRDIEANQRTSLGVRRGDAVELDIATLLRMMVESNAKIAANTDTRNTKPTNMARESAAAADARRNATNP